MVIRNLDTGQANYFYTDVNGHALSVAPPNQGPKATPNYEATLGQPTVFTLSNGMRVFAGPRDDAFYFDTGATFDYPEFPRARAGSFRRRRHAARARLIPTRWTASPATTSA